MELQLLRQEANKGVTYSYTIPATKSSSSPPSKTKYKHIPLPSLPSEEKDYTAGPSDQAAESQRQYDRFKPEEREQNQGYQEQYDNNQYSKSQSSRITNSDHVHYYKTSQNTGSLYTNSHFSVSNPGYNYVVNPYRERNQRGGGINPYFHRLRHHRSRHNRSRRHQVVVQSTPERRYDLQAQAGLPVTHISPSSNQPHVISALTPEGQRRYQYASQQSQSDVYQNQRGYPNRRQQSSYTQPLAGQAGYNSNLGVQGPPISTHQYGSYYQSINRG